jgi:hypothetical protein
MNDLGNAGNSMLTVSTFPIMKTRGSLKIPTVITFHDD